MKRDSLRQTIWFKIIKLIKKKTRNKIVGGAEISKDRGYNPELGLWYPNSVSRHGNSGFSRG
jgi:hypothetical protein